MEKDIILKRINKVNLFCSLLSLFSSLFLMFIIVFNNSLRSSLTYHFLMYIFVSEIINSIGNIIQSKDGNQFLILFIISFSDIFVYLLLFFFSYCSLTLIIETKRTIKNKANIFIIISFIVSILYSLILLIIGLIKEGTIVDVRFKNYYSVEDKDSITSPMFYFFSLIHTIFIMIISFITIHNFYNVLIFMNEKLKSEKVNTRNIAILMKILFRFPLILLLLLIFLIIRIGFVTFSDENNNILRDISYLFSESLFCLRATLLCLSTIKSSKIQSIITRFIEVNIKHYLLLNFEQFKKSSVKKAKKEQLLELE